MKRNPPQKITDNTFLRACAPSTVLPLLTRPPPRPVRHGRSVAMYHILSGKIFVKHLDFLDCSSTYFL